jgi:putative ABC transport system permease protein
MSTRSRLRRRDADDFAREIACHLELEIDRLVASGIPPEQARLIARRRFGNVTAVRERFHERGRTLWLDHLFHDVRCAARNIRRYPVAGLVAIASLAGGIGATTVTLTVRNAVFRKPPPLYRDPAQLSRVQTARPDRPILPAGNPVPGSLYALWSGTSSYPMAAALSLGSRDLRTGDRTGLAPVRAVTPDFFAVLGVNLALGRGFSSAASERAGPLPAVLSYRLWQTLFDARSDVVGQTIWIDERPHTVIGVLPARFWFSEMTSPIWTRLDASTLTADDSVAMIVRRPAGVREERLAAQLQSGLVTFGSRLPAAQRELRLQVSGIEGTPVGRQVSFVLPYLLAASVALTLLIACANVAILMIAQWTAREREIAIRASIGASRGRIIRGLLTESVLVAILGGAFGMCVTFALRGLVVQRAGDAAFFDLSIDPVILVQAAAVTLLTGIVTGIAPALYETRRLQANPLRTVASSDRVRQRWRHVLVVFEITVTVALLVETATMIDGYQRARQAEIGFPVAPLLSARVENPKGVPTTQTLEALGSVPGVAAVAASTGVPLGMVAPSTSVGTDASGSRSVTAERAAISPGFFDVLGVTLRAGRPFAASDSVSARAVIINQALANRLFPGAEAVGQRVWLQQTAYDVIGVVADYANNPLQPGGWSLRVFLLLPAASTDIRRVQFVMRAFGDPAPMVQPIRRRALGVAPGTIVPSAYTFEQILDVMGQEILVGTAPLFPLIAIGMFLTASGIYGVLAFAVTRRSRELAIRIAIGATSGDITKLVGGHGLRLVATGALLGGGLTFGLARIVRAGGGAGGVFDPRPPAFVVPIALVLAVGMLAMWIPSRRARRIDPAALLKGD